MARYLGDRFPDRSTPLKFAKIIITCCFLSLFHHGTDTANQGVERPLHEEVATDHHGA